MALDSEATPILLPLSCHDGVAVGAFGSVCIVIWRDEVIEERFHRQSAGLSHVVDAYPGRAGMLCVIEESAKPPNEELRSASRDMILALGDRLKCVACVIEGNGFKAALARSVLSSIALLGANRKAALGYFSTPASAGIWMQRHMSIDSVTNLSRAVAELRASLGPFTK